ncbi:hypothetical protein AVEN_10144-1 [Araneus ventricosus]|uniref:Uncharacterized protein n=1 Tax=Araneus ventricosus TaxID=182803 RepID=A0A4Y2JXZ5_ARAVE|nr:hypothetical protein AVEN_10144-1 [Araneus ventricosus]
MLIASPRQKSLSLPDCRVPSSVLSSRDQLLAVSEKYQVKVSGTNEYRYQPVADTTKPGINPTLLYIFSNILTIFMKCIPIFCTSNKITRSAFCEMGWSKIPFRLPHFLVDALVTKSVL